MAGKDKDLDDPAGLPGRFYAAICGLAEEQSEEDRHRRQAMGQLQDIAARLKALAADTAITHDIHGTDLTVLVLLYRANAQGMAKASAIQRSLGFTSGGVTRRLDALESRGLVERLPDPEDGRAKLVRLTDAGKALAARALERSDARNRRLHHAFSTEEWKTSSGCSNSSRPRWTKKMDGRTS